MSKKASAQQFGPPSGEGQFTLLNVYDLLWGLKQLGRDIQFALLAFPGCSIASHFTERAGSVIFSRPWAWQYREVEGVLCGTTYSLVITPPVWCNPIVLQHKSTNCLPILPARLPCLGWTCPSWPATWVLNDCFLPVRANPIASHLYYRKKWNNTTARFMDLPVHDIHSECADAFRQFGQCQSANRLTPKIKVTKLKFNSICR